MPPAAQAQKPPIPLLEMRGIGKSFGQQEALHSVDFSISAGEVVSLLGENGAGKTTLMNVAFGLIAPDRGSVIVDGFEVRSLTPRLASSLGIGMVHQHFRLVDEMTGLENISLGRGAAKLQVLTRVREIMTRTGFEVELARPVGELPVEQRQRLEILKALYGGSRLLILDEPTAALAPAQAADLMGAVARLAEQGTAVVLITHKLKEALAASSRVVVLRRGRVVLEAKSVEVSIEELAQAMVAREVTAEARQQAAAAVGGEALVSLRHVEYQPPRARGLRDLSFDVHSGEVVGIAGVEGNGQEALADLLAGVAVPNGGSITLEGADVTRLRPERRLQLGWVHVPPDRHAQALALEMSLSDNLLLGRWPSAGLSRAGVLQTDVIESKTRTLIESFDVRGGAPEALAASLSGGNQQKFVIGRQMLEGPRVLVACNPTRGLDIAATAYVHERIQEHRNSGGAAVLMSSDLDEILALSDRIIVLYEGRAVADFPAAVSIDELGLAMTGTA